MVGDHSTHTIDIYRGGDRLNDRFRYSNNTPPSGAGVADEDLLKMYSTPLLVKQLTPAAKLIVIMRDPVERLFSIYRMHEAVSKQDFHAGVKDGIQFWNACTAEKRPLAECLYYKLKPAGYVSSDDCTWSTRAIGSVRRGLYHYYLSEWLGVFPAQQLLSINFKHWGHNSSDVLNNHIFPFLGLPKLSGFNEIHMNLRYNMVVRRSRPKKDGRSVPIWHQGDMLPETRKLLQDFYAPHNRKLAKLLDDDSFLWTYS